jgi:polyferredoxin
MIETKHINLQNTPPPNSRIAQVFEKYKIPIIAFLIFVVIGIVMWVIRDIRYFYLFFTIGFSELSSRIIVIHYPKTKQFFRLLVQGSLSILFIVWLSLFIGVNFQFPEIFFDASAGIVTGALIQIIVARLILPFFLGNAFCSRACWTGFFFELTNSKKHLRKPPKKRSELLAWSYLILLIIVPLGVAFYFNNPATDEALRKKWIIGENLFIITVGFVLNFITGSRSYCRLLCPFITISGLFSRFSLFKITPVDANNCTSCNACTEACPMLIDVRQYVADKEKVDNKVCIVCERCVSACPDDILRLTNEKAK